MTVGDRVRIARGRRGWTQEVLAREAHVSRMSVHLLEAGKTYRPRAATVILLAHALGVRPDELLGLGEVGSFAGEADARAFLDSIPPSGTERNRTGTPSPGPSDT